MRTRRIRTSIGHRLTLNISNITVQITILVLHASLPDVVNIMKNVNVRPIRG